MKRVCICYHMKNDIEIAETCITLPMTDDTANEILKHQKDSLQVRKGIMGGEVSIILRELAKLQGYDETDFVVAHIAE